MGFKPEDENADTPFRPIKPMGSVDQAESLRSATPPLCWPFPLGSQNHTDKAIRLKPYTPPKRRSLNQF